MSLPGIRKPAAEQVKAYRAKHQCGLHEAKAALMKQWRQEILFVLRVQCSLGHADAALLGVIEYLQELEK